MKTAEVAIEHVLVGLLALCAFALPLLPGLNVTVDPKLLPNGALVGVLGMAYLFGIVFDKLADTFLSPIEQWLRLKKADDHLRKAKPCYDSDPFPQDALEFSLREQQGGRLEWMDSLRSRIRTSRGLAVLGLPAAMGIVIYQSFPESLNWWLHSFVVLNLIIIAGSIGLSYCKKFELPKTYKLNKNNRESEMKKARKNKRFGIFLYLLLIFSASIVCIIAALRGEGAVVIGTCGGGVASLLALWTWYCITETYMSFVYQEHNSLTKRTENVNKENLP